MATFEESFLYPLILLLIGAGLSGGLVTLLSHTLEMRRKVREEMIQRLSRDLEMEVERKRKELEIKTEVVSRMAEIIAYHIAEGVISNLKRKDSLNEVDIDAQHEKLKKGLVDGNIIRSKLESYFSEADIIQKWDDYFVVLQSFYIASSRYFLKDANKNPTLKSNLDLIRNYFRGNEVVDWGRLTPDIPFDPELYNEVTHAVGVRGDEIIKELLKLKVKDF
jgi:hypothetical protein